LRSVAPTAPPRKARSLSAKRPSGTGTSVRDAADEPLAVLEADLVPIDGTAIHGAGGRELLAAVLEAPVIPGAALGVPARVGIDVADRQIIEAIAVEVPAVIAAQLLESILGDLRVAGGREAKGSEECEEAHRAESTPVGDPAQ